MAELTDVTLDPAKGHATVEILFGNAHAGHYRCFLWNRDGTNPVPVAHGDNLDGIVDVFTLTDAPLALHDKIISVETLVQAAEVKPGQVYTVTISVRQAGSVCPGGLVEEAGVFEDVKALVAFRRLKAS